MKKFINKLYVLLFGFIASALNVYAQQGSTASGLLQSASTEIHGIGTMLLNVASGLIGVVGAIMLVWNFMKRAKGDQQSNDAIMNWGSALLFTALALQILRVAYF